MYWLIHGYTMKKNFKTHTWEWFLHKANNDPERAAVLKQEWVDRCSNARKHKSKFKRLSREWHIERYGEVEGIRKFEDFRARSIQTIENYIRKYGTEEGTKRFESVMKKKSQSLTRFIELYGEEEGTIKYNNWKSASGSLHYFVQKYGHEEGARRYNEMRTRQKEALQSLILPWEGKTRLDYCLEQYGPEDGPIKYKEWYEKTQMKRNKSSKKALDIFRELSTYAVSCGVSDDAVFYGGDGKNEWIVWNQDQSVKHSYDFTIRDLKLIVEYDGAAWHPTEEQVKNNPHGKLPKGRFLSFEEKYEWDQNKIKHADNLGWTVLIIRSDLSIIELHEKISLIKQTIKEKSNEIRYN